MKGITLWHVHLDDDIFTASIVLCGRFRIILNLIYFFKTYLAQMGDIFGILEERRQFLLGECDSYRMRSVLLLLDTCVSHIVLREPIRQTMVTIASFVIC